MLYISQFFPHSHKKNHLFRAKPQGEFENAKMCINAPKGQLTHNMYPLDTKIHKQYCNLAPHSLFNSLYCIIMK